MVEPAHQDTQVLRGRGLESHCSPPAGPSCHRCAPTCLKTESNLLLHMTASPLTYCSFLVRKHTRQPCNFNFNFKSTYYVLIILFPPESLNNCLIIFLRSAADVFLRSAADVFLRSAADVFLRSAADVFFRSAADVNANILFSQCQYLYLNSSSRSAT